MVLMKERKLRVVESLQVLWREVARAEAAAW